MSDDFEPLANRQAPVGVSIHNGFPNPAADRLGTEASLALDLNQLLIRHPSSTYLFRIHDDTQAWQGIGHGDIAIIDRALTAGQTDLVLTWHNEQFSVMQFAKLPSDCQVWGIVSTIIHPYRQN